MNFLFCTLRKLWVGFIFILFRLSLLCLCVVVQWIYHISYCIEHLTHKKAPSFCPPTFISKRRRNKIINESEFLCHSHCDCGCLNSIDWEHNCLILILLLLLSFIVHLHFVTLIAFGRLDLEISGSKEFKIFLITGNLEETLSSFCLFTCCYYWDS